MNTAVAQAASEAKAQIAKQEQDLEAVVGKIDKSAGLLSAKMPGGRVRAQWGLFEILSSASSLGRLRAPIRGLRIFPMSILPAYHHHVSLMHISHAKSRRKCSSSLRSTAYACHTHEMKGE